jgi:hypothetical protein
MYFLYFIVLIFNKMRLDLLWIEINISRNVSFIEIIRIFMGIKIYILQLFFSYLKI